MLDPVDETFFEFVDTSLNHVQTPQLQRKFAALGGIDLVVRLVAMSMNDDVIIKACRALSMLLQIEGNVGDSSLNSTPRSTLQQTPVSHGVGGSSISAINTHSNTSNASLCVNAAARSTSAAGITSTRPHAVINAIKICSVGGVAALIAQMRRSRNDCVLQESAAALKHLTRVYASTESLPDWAGVPLLFQDVEDAYAVIVHLFKRSRSPFVHSEIAEMLHYITFAPGGKSALGQAGGVGALVRQCLAPQPQRSVLVWACTALCVLVMDDDNRSLFTVVNGPEAVVELLRRLPATSLSTDMDWDDVVVGAIHTLSNYLAGSTGRSVHDLQLKVAAAGGAEELIKRCWGGLGSVPLLSSPDPLQPLQPLQPLHAESVTPSHTGPLAAAAPARPAAPAAPAAPASPGDLVLLCGGLARASSSSSTQHLLPPPRASSSHAGHGSLLSPPHAQAHAGSSHAHAGFRPPFSPHGVGAGAAGAARMKERVVGQCCAALCNLSFENESLRIKLGDLGACEMFTAVCQRCDLHRPPQKRILEQACAAVGNICKRNRSNRCRMAGAQGSETLALVLSRALLVGADADAVALQAVRAVSNVVIRNEENQQRFADAGGCQHLIHYCLSTRSDTLLRWVLTALGALAQDEVLKYRLVNEGALAAAAAAQRSSASEEARAALKRLTAQLPLPTPVLGSVILQELGETVCVQSVDDAWLPAHTARICNFHGIVTSVSASFVAECAARGQCIKDIHLFAAEQRETPSACFDLRKSPPGLTRIRIQIRERSVTIDAALNGVHQEDFILGPALLAKLKTLGFEHMVNEYITF